MPEVEAQAITNENIASTLLQIARQLTEVARSLSAQSSTAEEGRKLAGSAQALEEVSLELSRSAAKAEERNRLRTAILTELLRGGPALPMELAAAILAFVEDIQPVLEELEREGLIHIRRVAGADVIELTSRGREEARRLA